MKPLLVLHFLAQKLNQAGIHWCLGAGAMLYLRGLVRQFGDLDILVKTEDFDKAYAILKAYAEEEIRDVPKISENFAQFQLREVSVDLISGFTIITNEAAYRYRYPKRCDTMLLQDERIPLAALEDWLIAYQLMGRQEKYDLLAAYVSKEARISDCFEKL